MNVRRTTEYTFSAGEVFRGLRLLYPHEPALNASGVTSKFVPSSRGDGSVTVMITHKLDLEPSVAADYSATQAA